MPTKFSFRFITTFLFVCIALTTIAQEIVSQDSLKVWELNANTESMKQELQKNITDSSRADLLMGMMITYAETNIDSAFKYGNLYYLLTKKNNWTIKEAWGLDFLGATYLKTGNATRALQLNLEALRMFETLKDSTFRTINYRNIANAFNTQILWVRNP